MAEQNKSNQGNNPQGTHAKVNTDITSTNNQTRKELFKKQDDFDPRKVIIQQLNHIHGLAENRYTKGRFNDSDAKLLQDFLTDLKFTINSLNQDLMNSSESDINKAINNIKGITQRALIKKIVNTLIKENNSKNAVSAKTGKTATAAQLLNYLQSFMSVGGQKAGQYYEEQFAKVSYLVLKDILNNPNESSYIKTVNTGSTKGTTVQNLDINKIETMNTKNLLGFDLEDLGIKFSEHLNRFQGSDISKHLSFKYIKNDIRGIGNTQIALKTEASVKNLTQLQRIFYLGTFSLKSYKPYDKKALYQDLHLGNTNIYKAWMGVLSDLNYDFYTATTLYYGTLALMSKNFRSKNKIVDTSTDSAQAKIHLYHIRFIYELAGPGIILEGSNNKDQVSDFFVYNENSRTGKTYVRTTASIIKDILKDNSASAAASALGGIVMHKKDMIANEILDLGRFKPKH